MPPPYPINPETFDGAKFLARYALQPNDFFARLNNLNQLELFLSPSVILPDDPPIIDPPDQPQTVRRKRAKSTFNDTETIILRAILLLILREINTIRAALVPPLSGITIAQFQTALANVIDAGQAD